MENYFFLIVLVIGAICDILYSGIIFTDKN